MKVGVVMLRVLLKPEYQHGEKRLLESYYKHDAGYPHELFVINRDADPPENDSYPGQQLKYLGGGWDCGAWQFAGKNIETDLLCCFNSSCYITGPNWLKRFVEAVEAHGEGLYGPLTSYEVAPHVRTPCFVFQPKVIQGYPETVETRQDTYRFECLGWSNGTPNFTQWARKQGYQTRLVTWDGCYDLPDWRKPDNIFRRGDQSNLVIRDRHTDAYEGSDEQNKTRLAGLADGK